MNRLILIAAALIAPAIALGAAGPLTRLSSCGTGRKVPCEITLSPVGAVTKEAPLGTVIMIDGKRIR